LLVALLATFALVATARANQGDDTPLAAALSGSYRFVGGESEIASVEKAIEEAAEELNVFIRPIARRRLRDANLPASRLDIRVDGKDVTVESSGRPPITAPVGKAPVEWKNPDNGNTLRVSYRIPEPRVLEQRLRGDRGVSVLRHALDEAGNTLKIRTTITIDMLSSPLEFTTTYRRASGSSAATP
jgi:hypothetical protein